MNVVQPIRDLDMLQRCYEIAREHDAHARKGEVSWELILLVGFNTSMRNSDFTALKVDELRGREYAEKRAQKTGKQAKILINPPARRELKRLLAGRRGEELAFLSRQKGSKTGRRKQVTRQRVYQIINEIAREAGIQDKVGCHTLRKTFGFHYYKATGDVVSLQRILGHTSRRDTLVYIGIIQEQIDESLMNFSLVPKRRNAK